MSVQKKKPFMLRLKEFLEGVAGFSLFVSIFAIIGAFNGQEVVHIAIWAAIVGGVTIWLASKIKPRTITTAGAFVNQRKEW